MKALEILKKNKNVAKWVEPNYLKEAIAELEALENRSCFGCKYSSKTVSGSFCMCFSMYPDFEYCSDWKAK